MENSEALNAAADHIQIFGHRKHGLGEQGQPTCALGALQAVTGGRDANGWMQPGIKLLRYIERPDVAVWNNAPERTAEDVIAAMRACALIEAAREEQDAAWESYAANVVSA
jgi:hypothetical protein